MSDTLQAFEAAAWAAADGSATPEQLALLEAEPRRWLDAVEDLLEDVEDRLESVRQLPGPERTQVVERLAEKYGETLQSMGLHQSNAVMEIYASEATGTWTILVTRPDGQACLVAAGRMWEAHSTPARAPGKDV